MPRACAQLVSEGGAQGSQRMADPDTRLTDDLNKATDGFCNTFCNVLYTATAGVFHSVELWKHNWVLGLAPYVYLAVSFAFVDYITPVRKTWRPLGRERGRTWGIYCHGQMKLIEKAESVAALNGSEREARLFCEQSTAVRVACYKQHCKFWQFGMINHFFNTYLAGELFPIWQVDPAPSSPARPRPARLGILSPSQPPPQPHAPLAPAACPMRTKAN